MHICSTSSFLYSLVGQVGRVFASYTGGPWIKSWVRPCFLYRNKTSEYSEIYIEQLTSEPFLPYNHRSSTLPVISQNIGQLLRQCSGIHPNTFEPHTFLLCSILPPKILPMFFTSTYVVSLKQPHVSSTNKKDMFPNFVPWFFWTETMGNTLGSPKNKSALYGHFYPTEL